MTSKKASPKASATGGNDDWQATRTTSVRQGPLFDGEGRPPAAENLVDGLDDGVGDGFADGFADGPDERTGVQPPLTRKQAASGGLTGGAAQDDAEGEEPPPKPVLEAIADLLKANWMIVVGVATVLFVIVILVAILGGGPFSGADTAAAPAPTADRERTPQDSVPTDSSGVTFEAPVERDGTYYIEAGELAWKGRKEATESGERITLEGATAAQFTRAVALPGGSITTGVIGRAEPEGQTLHATYQQVNLGNEQKTSGTYYTIAGGLITSRGDYEDERDADTVTRTYDETRYTQGQKPERVTYRVTFVAPPEMPIPALVGHEDPPEVEGEPQ